MEAFYSVPARVLLGTAGRILRCFLRLLDCASPLGSFGSRYGE